jgi:DNA-binding MarR family transcriptional regulator
MRPTDERLIVWRRFSGTARWFQLAISRELEDTVGLSLAELEMLILVRASGGTLRMAELARRVGITKAGMTKMVDRVGEMGFVRREPSQEDRRVKAVVLTQRGRNILKATRPRLERWLEERFHSCLSAADMAAVDRAMRKLIAHNDVTDPADRP